MDDAGGQNKDPYRTSIELSRTHPPTQSARLHAKCVYWCLVWVVYEDNSLGLQNTRNFCKDCKVFCRRASQGLPRNALTSACELCPISLCRGQSTMRPFVLLIFMLLDVGRAPATGSSMPVQQLRCHASHVSYHPSQLELRWYNAAPSIYSDDPAWPEGCAMVKEDEPQFDVQLNFIQQLHSNPVWMSEPVDDPKVKNVMSAFHVTSACGARVTYIEPLVGALRHPKYPCLHPGALHPGLFDMSWLAYMPPPVQYHRAYYFDLGSTYYNSGYFGEADSLKAQLERFQKFANVIFDEVFCWEAVPVDDKDYWSRIPIGIAEKIHFFNVPTSANISDPQSALGMVSRLAKRDDFVVFKLDIDNSEVEVEIIRTLLRNKQLLKLIDEIFWEHHVAGSPLQRFWGDLSLFNSSWEYTLPGSYDLFHRLRQAGIRAHSWV